MNWSEMNWEDVEGILFEGTREQIDGVKCPDCGGELRFLYYPMARNTEIFCKGCHIVLRSHGAKSVPNFALFATG